MSLDEAREKYLETHRVTEGTPGLNRFTDNVIDASERGLNGGYNFIRSLHAAMGLAGESGEVLELFKKELFGYSYEGKRGFTLEALEKELGDILWYLTLMTESTGISLEKLYESNAQKLRERYAHKFEKKEEHEENKQLKIFEDKVVLEKVRGVMLTKQEMRNLFTVKNVQANPNPFGQERLDDESIKEILRYNEEGC